MKVKELIRQLKTTHSECEVRIMGDEEDWTEHFSVAIDDEDGDVILYETVND